MLEPTKWPLNIPKESIQGYNLFPVAIDTSVKYDFEEMGIAKDG